MGDGRDTDRESTEFLTVSVMSAPVLGVVSSILGSHQLEGRNLRILSHVLIGESIKIDNISHTTDRFGDLGSRCTIVQCRILPQMPKSDPGGSFRPMPEGGHLWMAKGTPEGSDFSNGVTATCRVHSSRSWKQGDSPSGVSSEHKTRKICSSGTRVQYVRGLPTRFADSDSPRRIPQARKVVQGTSTSSHLYTGPHSPWSQGKRIAPELTRSQ
ncbi:hypothetical protein F5J12DRAFT_785152 [Pisolithus orientalis]|uniref:uncharacterized protein n=1 Tax=Pisolithus orientalis TaxID=936130 RepID=UPI0022241985|nr:uncharacterized protein F5J12DRAFT_785152 [Pisolithus orientalis]KAI5997693.1 hypothetical protein F5J12DRAFT_785152 [Pisolithus orientalis]